MRLPPRPGERIDRSTKLTFTFEGDPVEAFAGDTIGSALYAGGRRVFSRSFKYHRPRGLLCCSGHCANCMMQVDGVPNVRVCAEPVREGADVRAQNVWGSVDRDLLSIIDKAGGPFTPVGFYYRMFMRPRAAWPYYEKVLRRIAGLGKLDKHAHRQRRFDTEHRHAEVLVIGGGDAGLRAAREAAARGEQVVLVDENASNTVLLDGVEVIAPASAIGIYEGGLVPVAAGSVLYRFRADRIVVAAGAHEQPLVFPGNDLVGVLLPGAVRRMVQEWAVKPGERAVVITADDRGLEAAALLREARVDVAEVVDLRKRHVRRIEAEGRGGRVRAVKLDGKRIACDVLVMSGGAQPAYSLLAQAGAHVAYDAETGTFVATDLPPGVEGAGRRYAAPVRGTFGDDHKSFVCVCEDVTVKDLQRSIKEGFDSLELAKRYTTVTMGPCQGRLCHLNSIRLHARETATGESAIGTTTARPPWTPVPLGLLAGRPYEPTKRTSIHERHKELGATMMWTGVWRRPHSYGDVEAEVRAVHEDVGIIDVSTLGKLLVLGPDAAAFLERLYPNKFADLAHGRIRYGVLGTDGGRIMDDGTIGRLGDEEFYVTTTSTGADVVVEWFEWWNAIWRMDVEIVDVTGALAAINVAGPRARELLSRLTDLDLSNEAFKYLDAKQARVAGVPSLLLRIGFVGELGYEIHLPSPYGEHVWDRLLELGAKPFGLEPQRILRLEKMHIIVGQDTDSESNALAANMPWIVKFDKDDFVGKWALGHVQERGFREKLVGFETQNGTVPAEGGQVVVDGRPAGRVTSARWSEEVGGAIGMAWVPAELAEEGATIGIRVNGRIERAAVRLAPFFDPEGERLRS